MTLRPRSSAARRILAATVWLSVCGACLAASRPAERARSAMVAGPEPLAVEAGLAVLREGGNAVDAAVTMGLTLAVTLPQAGNLGGGGYLLMRAPNGTADFIDFRETAPAAARREMFLDPNGEVIPKESTETWRASGVPGTVAGLSLALRKHGTISMARALKPAVRLARDGFVIDRGLERALAAHAQRLAAWPSTRAIFFRNDKPLQQGDTLTQKDLGMTLSRISKAGAGALYSGDLAQALEREMKAHGGLITVADMAAYRPIERAPLAGSYRGYGILSAPPSSSGGVGLLQMLAMLEPRQPASLGPASSAYVHLVSEAAKRAYADRARWLGDPAFFKVPVARLLAPAYTARMMAGFDNERATPAAAAGPGDPLAGEGAQTTHYSIVDASGMAVSVSVTLNDSFGCGAVAGSLGFLLNNEMDDFAARPGAPNLYGLVGGEANSIAPGKRMLSSMTPTIVTRRDPGGAEKLLLVLGTPGGATIITTVLQVFLNVVEFDMELQAAVDAPRFHHQWLPDVLQLDAGGFPSDVVEALRRKGHVVETRPLRGDVQAIQRDADGSWLRGASDARGYGVARGY